MTEPKQAEAKPVTEPHKVIAEGGTTFDRKEYKRGDTINCTADQAKILKAQGVI